MVLADAADVVRVARDDRGKNGPRLLVEDLTTDQSVALCPLELEALVWADEDAFAAVAPDGVRGRVDPQPAGADPRLVRIANEFSTIGVRAADGPHHGIVVVDLRSGGAARLSLRALTRLAACGHDTLATLIAGAL
jgi:hypothetical protein